MITKGEIKKLCRLSQKKYRKEYKLFLIEGPHIISEALKAKTPGLKIYVSESFFCDHKQSRFIKTIERSNIFETTNETINKISNTVSPQGIVATCPLPQQKTPNLLQNNNWLYLDHINDPGNLGTMLRNTTWFGLTNVALSPECADPHASKTIRSGAGAHFHLSIFRNIKLSKYNKKIFNIIGTDQTGISLSETLSQTSNPWVLVLGNESHGISPKNRPLLTQTISIPKKGEGESLNLAVAGGIFLYELTKTLNKKG